MQVNTPPAIYEGWDFPREKRGWKIGDLGKNKGRISAPFDIS